MMTRPSDRFVDLALLTLACCAGQLVWAFGKFYGFGQVNAVVEMIGATATTAFSGDRDMLARGFPVANQPNHNRRSGSTRRYLIDPRPCKAK